MGGKVTSLQQLTLWRQSHRWHPLEGLNFAVDDIAKLLMQTETLWPISERLVSSQDLLLRSIHCLVNLNVTDYTTAYLRTLWISLGIQLVQEPNPKRALFKEFVCNWCIQMKVVSLEPRGSGGYVSACCKVPRWGDSAETRLEVNDLWIRIKRPQMGRNMVTHTKKPPIKLCNGQSPHYLKLLKPIYGTSRHRNNKRSQANRATFRWPSTRVYVSPSWK